MTPTPSDLLARHAPRDDAAAGPSLDAVLDRVLAGAVRGPSTDRRRIARRAVLLGAGVAAATATTVLVPAGLRRSDAGVQALERLAVTAGTRPTAVIAPGSFLHLVTVDNPGGGSLIGGVPETAVYPRRLESWTAADGTIWRYDSEAGGAEQYWRFDPTMSAPDTDVSPGTLTTLPTNPRALLDHLRGVMRGPSEDAATFRYLATALRTGYAPSAVQRAMIGTMALLPGVTSSPRTSWAGTRCLAATYADPDQDGLVLYVYFDERAATLVEEGELDPEGRPRFTSVVLSRDVVNEVPQRVLERSADSPQG